MDRMRDDRVGYYREDRCDLADFATLASRRTGREDCPNARSIAANIPVYDANALGDFFVDADKRRTLMAEWARILQTGPGVLAIRSAATDLGAIDAATKIFEDIVAEEKQRAGGGDHFAKAGANDRIWNSLQKLCEASPSAFACYFANPAVDAVCEAWLGPNYQMTAQVNVVHPGGEAQLAHRDYHLGFQTMQISSTYPSHVHDLSPLITLQGAIAHCDMPVESGPTKLLPFSQLYRPGYAAWRRDDFRAYFEEHFVQSPLAKGDGLFFNPALFHAAGANTSNDIHRMANLLQISSAFGRAMETIDRKKMAALLYPKLKELKDGSKIGEPGLNAAIAACAEGYSFPTNLDNDPPIGGLAPETQAQLMRRALAEGMDDGEFIMALDEQERRRRA